MGFYLALKVIDSVAVGRVQSGFTSEWGTASGKDTSAEEGA
jgi:hypothetical protein